MKNFTLTRDVWALAEREVDKIKPDKIIILENDSKLSVHKKSMNEIFKSGISTMTKILPRGSIKSVTTTNEQVPESVKLLDTYAQKMGFLPMGSIYEKSGNKYIGRSEEITEKGEKFYRPFPELKETFFDTPNLIQNLSFRANKAIEKWNDFVSAEAELGEFLEKTETEEGRKKLILEFAKTSSLWSDYLKILSSLYFYYVDTKSTNLNILGIPEESIYDLKRILISTGKIKNIYEEVITIIASANTKNEKLFKRIKEYHEYKVRSLEASLNSEEFKLVKELLDEEKAYVPQEMIQIPTVEQSEWFKILQKEGFKQSGNDSKLVIENWNPNEKWFKAINYLR